MNQNPWLLIILIGGGFWLVWIWIRDLRNPPSEGDPKPLPGANYCQAPVIWFGVALGLALVGIETVGESWLGLTEQQTVMSPLFAIWTLIAAFVEELIFRGHFFVGGRGPVVLWCSIISFSALFALLHPFLWSWESEGFEWTLGLKGWFSTAFAFGGSIAFYALRFNKWNPALSLLPCFAAHLAKNAGVIAVKASQGYFSGF